MKRLLEMQKMLEEALAFIDAAPEPSRTMLRVRDKIEAAIRIIDKRLAEPHSPEPSRERLP